MVETKTKVRKRSTDIFKLSSYSRFRLFPLTVQYSISSFGFFYLKRQKQCGLLSSSTAVWLTGRGTTQMFKSCSSHVRVIANGKKKKCVTTQHESYNWAQNPLLKSTQNVWQASHLTEFMLSLQPRFKCRLHLSELFVLSTDKKHTSWAAGR